MKGRDRAVELTSSRYRLAPTSDERELASHRFGARVFSFSEMQKMLPPEVYANVVDAIDGGGKIKPQHADSIAVAMKEWAVGHGATHYCHWFQPLTGATAEKHDSFLQFKSSGEVLEKFSGKELIQGEPDASSFPSGGLRSTYEARGYTGWDPTTPPFVWSAGDGVTLYIPSVFFSWTGEVLDNKIPLLRTDEKLNRAVLRLLKHCGTKAKRVYSTLGWEQEYFVVDRAMRNLRPDLVIAGRTVFGAPPPKGQELDDHYFGAIKDRVLCYMQDVENHALELGIPLKTRHNEVAPSQHEFAVVYEKTSAAVDHNILMMELMRQVAVRHDLAALLHEKPFAGLNGSGKHNNWSLATDTGINLLDPDGGSDLQFLFLLSAILSAVHRHADLLRASIASFGNDFRLGANEAPPAIISVFLGDQLEEIIENMASGGTKKESGPGYDLGIPHIPQLPKDLTDRNRTSPFAFTGNKFEYRAVGSMQNCAAPMTVLNAAVAEALTEMLDEAEQEGDFQTKALEVIAKRLEESKAIRFSGDNYSSQWEEEAARRGLPNLKKSFHAFKGYLDPKTNKLFKGILTKAELAGRYEIMVETYVKTAKIEVSLCLELFWTHILPAAVKALGKFAKVNSKIIGAVAGKLEKWTELAIERADGINSLIERIEGMDLEEAGALLCDNVVPASEELREAVDAIEGLVDDDLWSLPKYRELLFLV